MKTSLYALTIAAAAAATFTVSVPAAAQSRADQQRWEEAQRRFDRERDIYERERERYEEARRYGYNRYDNDRGYGGYDEDRYATEYDAARYYRDDPRYQERVLSENDQVFRGSDGRYYCRRSDGTTGLIIGGATGGILGNVIDGGRSRGAGTLIGGALGALLGREVQRQQVRCR
ncbi:MAG TPA: glycine zipper 2TM domain-containing protein [Allosphingosinicella sp.]|jgi:hypothetical protein